ncbi:hypothetical protein [Streptacidiphilus albus]|uniref:hypothetical protein n=1 Tax=Streptacidiphilus albus TaxID=105425 RepID=UPI00068F0C4F|nr:hypothetical protein [Streptacidiphilus albus]
MEINGEAQQRGHILLIGGAPGGRRRQPVRPEASLTLLATLPTSALLGSAVPADTVQLADPADPQLVLAHLRRAAATPGPLVLVLVGCLTVDHRHHEPHLALARSRPENARYTALPWAWLAHEFRDRPPGSTRVLADLVADKDAWALLASAGPAVLTGPLPVWGQVSPPETVGETLATPYVHALVELLRHVGDRPLFDVHRQAVASAGLPAGALPLGTDPADAPVPVRSAQPVAVRPVVTAPAMGVPVAAAPAPAPVPVPAQAVAAVPPMPCAPPPTAVPPTVSVPALAAAPPTVSVPEPAAADDPLAAIGAALGSGDLEQAKALALAAEEQAVRTAGPRSPRAIQAREARAHLAHLSHDESLAAELWRDSAEDRLTFQGPDDAEVRAAVDNAHACWSRVQERRSSIELAPGILALRRKVPGAGSSGLRAAERRLQRIYEAAVQTEG